MLSETVGVLGADTRCWEIFTHVRDPMGLLADKWQIPREKGHWGKNTGINA